MEKEKDDIFKDEPVENKKEKKSTKLLAEIEVLKEENKKLFKEKEDLNTKLLLEIAESRNYKKRMDDEQTKFYKYSTYSICSKIVEVLDSFDLALSKDSENDAIKAYLNGFKMIRNQLYQVLEKEGVTEVEAIGKIYDPNFMEAMSQVTIDGKLDQEVINVFLKGYMYKERLLRPAKVIINHIEEREETSQE